MSGIQIPGYALHLQLYRIMIEATEGDERKEWEAAYNDLLSELETEEIKKSIRRLTTRIQTWN